MMTSSFWKCPGGIFWGVTPGVATGRLAHRKLVHGRGVRPAVCGVFHLLLFGL